MVILKNLAKVIITVGSVMTGQVETIYISGGSSCDWVAAWCDYVLGLRVQVNSPSGNNVYKNFDSRTHEPQIVLNFQQNTAVDSIQCIGRAIIIRSGIAFLKMCFGTALPPSQAESYSGGRLEWETLFVDVFGSDFTELLQGCPQERSEEVHKNTAVGHKQLRIEGMFQIYIGACITLAFRSSLQYYYPDVTACISCSISRFPELKCLQGKLILLTKEHKTFSTNTVLKGFDWAGREIEHYCRCAACLGDLEFYGCQYLAEGRSRHPIPKAFCQKRITCTIVKLLTHLAGVIFDSPLRLTWDSVIGIYSSPSGLASKYPHGTLCKSAGSRNTGPAVNELVVREQPIPDTTHIWESITMNLEGDTDHGPGELLSQYDKDLSISDKNTRGLSGTQRRLIDIATIFSVAGVDAMVHPFDQKPMSALGDSKVFCYISGLQQISADLKLVSTIHVGSGSIEHDGRHYNTVHDTPNLVHSTQISYLARSERLSTNVQDLMIDNGHAWT